MNAPLRVFSQSDRVDDSAGAHSEPTARFLDRIAGPYWDQVRHLIETWVSHYPESARADIVGRLRSPLNPHFRGAFWELYLHEMFLRAGFDVEVHPAVPSGPRPPDFLVMRGDTSYYVEARALSSKEDIEEARRNGVLDLLNTVKDANFFVDVTFHAIGDEAPSTKRLRRELAEWLANLDPDALASQHTAWTDFPRFEWAQDGWSVEFKPLPVRADARHLDHRLVGAWAPSMGALVEDEQSISSALSDKGSAYGKLDRPLVIALNLWSGFHDFESMNALYGTTQLLVDRLDPEKTQYTRSSNGYWGQPGHWHHHHVSGVLLGPNVAPWSVGTAVPEYWPHPAPQVDVPALRWWAVSRFETDRIVEFEPQKPIESLFGLPTGWPQGEPFPRRRAS